MLLLPSIEHLKCLLSLPFDIFITSVSIFNQLQSFLSPTVMIRDLPGAVVMMLKAMLYKLNNKGQRPFRGTLDDLAIICVAIE